MGNADYDMIECTKNRRNKSECDEKYENIVSMNIYPGLAKIKVEMENLGFLTISFINLNVEDYLRSIALLKKLCNGAAKPLVLVYVAGHGHNYLGKDYLIPVDSQHHYHLHGHKHYLKESMNCGLHRLMNCFNEFNINPSRFTVGVLWDLCRCNA